MGNKGKSITTSKKRAPHDVLFYLADSGIFIHNIDYQYYFTEIKVINFSNFNFISSDRAYFHKLVINEAKEIIVEQCLNEFRLIKNDLESEY